LRVQLEVLLQVLSSTTVTVAKESLPLTAVTWTLQVVDIEISCHSPVLARRDQITVSFVTWVTAHQKMTATI